MEDFQDDCNPHLSWSSDSAVIDASKKDKDKHGDIFHCFRGDDLSL